VTKNKFIFSHRRSLTQSMFIVPKLQQSLEVSLCAAEYSRIDWVLRQSVPDWLQGVLQFGDSWPRRKEACAGIQHDCWPETVLNDVLPKLTKYYIINITKSTN